MAPLAEWVFETTTGQCGGSTFGGKRGQEWDSWKIKNILAGMEYADMDYKFRKMTQTSKTPERVRNFQLRDCSMALLAPQREEEIPSAVLALGGSSGTRSARSLFDLWASPCHDKPFWTPSGRVIEWCEIMSVVRTYIAKVSYFCRWKQIMGQSH